MAEIHKVTVLTYQKPKTHRLALTVLSQVGVIGIGVWTESTAMQWCGFLLLAIWLLALTKVESNKSTAISIAQARKYLDELEEGEAA